MRRIALAVLLLTITDALFQTLPAGASRPAQAALRMQPEREERLAVIVNRSNPVENLSFAELRRIFLGERRHWPNSRRITVVMLEPEQPERKAVLTEIYQMNERDFNRHFVQATFTGEVFSAPKTLATSTGVRKFVFNLPGAIGYVRAEEVDDSVKVIRVDGRLPGDKGYKLKCEAR